MAAIFDFSQIRTSVILMSTLVVLPDLENIGMAVGISFLSCIKTEICVVSYLLPVNGSHLWFLTDPNIGHSYEYSSRVARPRKHGIALGILLLLRTQPKIQVLYMYFRFMAAIVIFGMDFCHRLFLLSAATLLSWKTWNTDHCIAYHWSFTLVMMMPFSFRNLFKIVSTDICCRGRHRVTTGNVSMGKPP